MVCVYGTALAHPTPIPDSPPPPPNHHTTPQENQKRIWVAEQNAKEKEKREKASAAQLAKEMEA